MLIYILNQWFKQKNNSHIFILQCKSGTNQHFSHSNSPPTLLVCSEYCFMLNKSDLHSVVGLFVIQEALYDVIAFYSACLSQRPYKPLHSTFLGHIFIVNNTFKSLPLTLGAVRLLHAGRKKTCLLNWK